tara:strand:- start:282 stop:683 length:402 start_codon:yes stop_codon:yes gene_type:complete
MPFRFSKSSKNRLLGVDPDIFKVARLAIQITKIDFGIPLHGGLRTQVEQNELFHAGLSKCDGYEKISSHQTGEALDVYAYVDGKASWDEQHLTMVAAAMLQSASQLGVGLEWGGLWKSFIDMPHYQLKKRDHN